MEERENDNIATDETRSDTAEDALSSSTAGAGGVVSPAVAKKRLLPMELRRRRRAAKLQTFDNVAPAAADAAQQQEQVETDRATPPSRERSSAPELSSGSGDMRQKESRHEPENEREQPVESSPAESAGDVAAAAPLERFVSAPTPSTAASRLRSFYNWSAIDRKRQKVQNRMQMDVPSKFHLDDSEKLPQELCWCTFNAPKGLFADVPVAQDPENAIRWHHALRYFTHPATPLPAFITLNRMAVATTTDTSMTGKSEVLKDELEFYASRLLHWQDAFRDVYFGFRGMRDDRSFYVRSNEFIVCFYQEEAQATTRKEESEEDPHLLAVCRRLREQAAIQPQEEGKDDAVAKTERQRKRQRRELCAVMSQSSARIRKSLHRLNIEYTTPYSSANSTQRDIGQFHLLEAELVAMESQSQTASRAAPMQQNVHGPDSLLHFSGHHAVHGLYEFLINRKPFTKQDVPEIYALHPFANAAIKSLDVKYMGQVAATASTTGEESATMFRTEVSGFCFPSSLREILQILKDEHQERHAGEQMPPHRPHVQHLKQQRQEEKEAATNQSRTIAIRAYMEPVPATERLNALHLTDGAIRKKSASGTTLEERERWKQELELSKRRIESIVFRQQSAEESLFEVETTARTNT